MKKASRKNSEFAEIRHGDAIWTLKWRHGSTFDQRATDVRLFVFLSFPRAGTGTWVKTKEIPIWWARDNNNI